MNRPRLVGINHVALEVDDIDAALAFYGQLFELEVIERSASGSSARQYSGGKRSHSSRTPIRISSRSDEAAASKVVIQAAESSRRGAERGSLARTGRSAPSSSARG